MYFCYIITKDILSFEFYAGKFEFLARNGMLLSLDKAATSDTSEDSKLVFQTLTYRRQII